VTVEVWVEPEKRRKKMPAFNVGDLMRLKSGGPTMTILEIYVDDKSLPTKIVCGWFGRDGSGDWQAILNQADFPPNSLKKVPE